LGVKMKISRYIKSFAILSVTAILLASCNGKDKPAAKTEEAASSQNQAANQGTIGGEEDFGDWFMAQTHYAPVESVVATSELVEAQFEGKYLYPPINILDGDFDSTWCEADENGSGIGESITIEFSEPVSFDEIQIVNGFASKDYYKKNNRVKSITLTQTASKLEVKDWDSEKSQYKTETKNHFQQKVYYLEDDKPEWQSIKFELPQTAQTITIKINEIYKGEKYDDTCLDDMRLLYKGNVIPFANVEEVKALQEENSRQMLAAESATAFEKQFYDLFDGSDCIYLVGDDPRDLLTFVNYGDELSMIYGASDLIETGDSHFAFMGEVSNSEYHFSYMDKEDNFYEQYQEFPKTKYVILGWKTDSYYNRSSYTVGNYRILKTESISYVETTTSIIAKIEGEYLYLNGTKYKVIPGSQVTDWRYWDGP
ncbi:MAG: hypothetical protein II547_05280, partial [Treponema sp.]|nr:hypothetical protein [Treponema sp.]